ncbi:lipid phosphate phosphatase 1 [Podospora fimiseda]|uniref:Lipid phosphate phosphatase 1 n=1 Tax=Podospora fimiseda TaxID=252190 RepID=A0AAN7BG95_9PEZI|nr:lipid phosphate phosphatase 1 [Podospora fimiseda]
MSLPFHRRERRRESREAAKINNAPDTSATHSNRNLPAFQEARDFVLYWIRVSWKDILAMAVFGGSALAIYKAPLAATRNFPVTFTTSGDIVYPEFAYPSRGWIIPPELTGVVSTLIPLVIISIAQLRIKSFWDFNNAVFGLLYSLILSALFQVILKMLIGGFRPYFLSVCQPDISLASSNNATGLNGVGFQQIMYTSEICTNPDKAELKTAMTSFPSGHATSAFAGYIYLFLWMNAKLKVWSNFQASFYWLAALVAPLLGATLLAACLTIDQAHNWYDIVAGAAIGTMTSVMSYRICYAAVWDWRYNHVPLTRDRVFDYAAAEVRERATFVRKLGWGKRKIGGGRRWGRESAGKKRMAATEGVSDVGGGSARSSQTYARNSSAVSPHSRPTVGNQGVMNPPQAAMARGGNGYPERGDELV